MNRTSYKFTVSVVNQKYYFIVVEENIEFTINDFKQLVAFEKEMGGKILPALVIIPSSSSTDSDVIKYISKNENNPYTKVSAFVISSLAHKILANFYMKFATPQRPTKFFKDKETALMWLNHYF